MVALDLSSSWYEQNVRNDTIMDQGKFLNGKTGGNRDADRKLAKVVEPGDKRMRQRANGGAGRMGEEQDENRELERKVTLMKQCNPGQHTTEWIDRPGIRDPWLAGWSQSAPSGRERTQKKWLE